MKQHDSMHINSEINLTWYNGIYSQVNLHMLATLVIVKKMQISSDV